MALNSLVRRGSSWSSSILTLGIRSAGRRFSSSTSDLDIESDMASQKSSNVPDEFPFKVHDFSRNEYILLERRFGDELIKAHVRFDPYKQKAKQMYVEIFNGKNITNFEINPLGDQMAVRKMSMSGNLNSLRNFWRMRGLDLRATKFIYDYCQKKNELQRKGLGLQLIPSDCKGIEEDEDEDEEEEPPARLTEQCHCYHGY